jgi:hypothetical protein
MTVQRPEYQLEFELDLEELTADGGPLSVEEVRLRSEAARQVLEGNSSLKWMEEYAKLRDGGWPWRVAAYIAWASSPHPRTPKTQDELAQFHLGLTSDRQISKWRKKNPAIDEMVVVLQASPLWESRAKDFEVLNEGAEKAGKDYKFFKHLELKMLMRQDYVPASKLAALLTKGTLNRSDLDEMSDADLAALARTVMDEAPKRIDTKPEDAK